MTQTQQITLYTLTCLKCGHTWESKNPHPLRCPGYKANGVLCGRPDWDRPRKEGAK